MSAYYAFYQLTRLRRWVNPIESYIFGESKPFQLHMAGMVGLATPDSIVSNDEREVRHFATDFAKGVALKRVSHPPRGSLRPGSKLRLYTTKLTRDDFTPSRLSSLGHCPVHIEDYIEKKTELRTYVVGSKVYTAEILSQGYEGTKIDWRHYPTRRVGNHLEVDYDKWKIRKTSLPSSVERRCVTLARRLGMRYAAMDLIRTPEGEYVFLEANSSGAFAFVEAHAKLPISRALARHLLGRDGFAL